MAKASPLKRLAYVLAIMTLIFSGGCGALFLAGADGTYVTWQVVLLFTAPPVLIALWVMRMTKPEKTDA
jgi:hypothetical protein